MTRFTSKLDTSAAGLAAAARTLVAAPPHLVAKEMRSLLVLWLDEYEKYLSVLRDREVTAPEVRSGKRL